MKTLEQSVSEYKAAIRLTKILSRGTLLKIRLVSFVLAVACSTAYVATYFFFEQKFIQSLLGGCLIFWGIWLEQMISYGYHNSYYFRGLNSITDSGNKKIEGATYDVAEMVLKRPNDVAMAFCASQFGSSILIRSGLSMEAVDNFLKGDRQIITAGMVMLPEDEIFSVIGLGKYILKHDTSFKKMLKEGGIKEETFHGALRWVIGSHHREKRSLRWWGKDNLSKITGIGREWSYGTAYLLQKFSRDIRTSSVFSTLKADSSFAAEKISDIEHALVRSKAANVLIIGEAGVGKIDLVMEVANRIKTGKSLNSILDKQIVVLDSDRLFAANEDKQDLELTLLQIFDEATVAGNVIVVIENISSFIRQAQSMGVFVTELLDQYLALPQIQVIATDTPENYHTYLEKMGAFTNRFAEVLIESPDLSATTRILQDVALYNEAKYKILFTYSALEAITTAADRYVIEGVMPNKAVELLVDVATKASQSGTDYITADYVFETVSHKTGVPAGPVQDHERDMLLNLEDYLHQQVVGQQPALKAIARTIRRSRAGIQSADKPIGSFLFLGPTGVGKTETAKALAKIFFGGEDKMQRLDMSEYSGRDALEKLIGDGEKAGTLPTILREHAYCVLLLDEFEKASQPVHDIFLQSLDEGQFTDSRGTKVNARNTIIIATSNAGSKLILKTVQQRKNLATLSQEIINYIIREGIYRPELINRFDSTIIFEPLTIEQQMEVASLMMGGLYKRVKEQGYELKVGEDLLRVLVEKGYNPEFGARPMLRVIQDLIEEKIAQKIISGEIHKGDSINLSINDFSETELMAA